MLRTTGHETAWQETDPYLLLLEAMVRRAWADLAMPTRQRSHRAELPTLAEQEEAWAFLREMMNAADRAIGQIDEEVPCYSGLDACRSPLFERGSRKKRKYGD